MIIYTLVLYEEKFAALLSNTKHSVEYELKKGFVSVPKGCYIYLEKKASEYVLQNIRSSIETRNGIVAKIASYEEDTGKALTLNKSDKDYLPTTMHQDYSINKTLFHWQSKSTDEMMPLEPAGFYAIISLCNLHTS